MEARFDKRRLSAFVAAFLWLILAGVFAGDARTQAQQATPTEGTITATVVFTQSIEVAQPGNAPQPIDLETLGKGGFFTPFTEIDNGGNIFTGYIRNDGLTAQGRVLRRNPAGVTTGRWEINVGTIQGIQHKADGISAVISADDLLLTLTSHATNATGPRIMALWGADLQDVAIPYGASQRPTGAPGGNVGASTGDCATLDQISALMDLKFAAFLNSMRQPIEDKVKDAIGEGFDKNRYSLDQRDKYIQDAASTFMRDRAYEADQAYCREHACGGPLPTPTRVP